MNPNENMNIFITPLPSMIPDGPLSPTTALQRPGQELGNDEHLKDLRRVHKTGNNRRVTKTDIYVLQVSLLKTINEGVDK